MSLPYFPELCVVSFHTLRTILHSICHLQTFRAIASTSSGFESSRTIHRNLKYILSQFGRYIRMSSTCTHIVMFKNVVSVVAIFALTSGHLCRPRSIGTVLCQTATLKYCPVDICDSLISSETHVNDEVRMSSFINPSTDVGIRYPVDRHSRSRGQKRLFV